MAAKPSHSDVGLSVSTRDVSLNKHCLEDLEIPVQSEVHEYEPVPLQKTKTGGSSKNKFKTMFDKVLQFSQENYGYQHKRDQTPQAPVDQNPEEDVRATSTSEGVSMARSSSDRGVTTNPDTADSPSYSNGQSQSNMPAPEVESTMRTRSPEQQETIKSSSLLQDQTPQRQENATDPTTSSTTNELSIVEPTTSPTIHTDTPVVPQPAMVTTTNITKTIQADAIPTKHKKSSFFTKLFKKKSSR